MEAPIQKFPLNANDYKLYEEIGEGVSASVYRALCLPLNQVVAIKVLDLEKCKNDLDGIRQEVQTMSLINHPNLIRAYGSFITGHTLWVVMPYMGGGSCLHIMKSSFPEGFEEPVIATLLAQVLKALVYLHAHGHIHRDVKAGNILADYDGSIKLADFGVSACMFDAGDRQRSRNTFVGTPCWMAPEVMQPLNGYDFKADIWSFGITALELAHGHAPFSKYPPMKVLLMTLQNAPPGLDYERDKKFSKAFKDMVATCLVKDPKKRPSSEKLLKHPFFKHAKTSDYLERKILDNLSPLGDRYRLLKAKEADLLVQNKDLCGDKEHLSQQEYIKGISAWNFNLEDLKNQAALIKDYDDISNVEDTKSSEQQNGINGVTIPATKLSPVIYNNNKNNNNTNNNINYNNHPDDKSHDTADESGSLLQENIVSPKNVITNGERDYHQPRFQVERNYSGPLQHLHKNNMTNSLSIEDFSEGPMVQHKGRFKITNADFSPKGPVLNLSSGGITSPLTSANPMENVERGNSDSYQMSPSATERELRSEVIQLRQSVGSLVEQLQRQKMENAQLEKKYSDLVKKNGIKE